MEMIGSCCCIMAACPIVTRVHSVSLTSIWTWSALFIGFIIWPHLAFASRARLASAGGTQRFTAHNCVAPTLARADSSDRISATPPNWSACIYLCILTASSTSSLCSNRRQIGPFKTCQIISLCWEPCYGSPFSQSAHCPTSHPDLASTYFSELGTFSSPFLTRLQPDGLFPKYARPHFLCPVSLRLF